MTYRTRSRKSCTVIVFAKPSGIIDFSETCTSSTSDLLMAFWASFSPRRVIVWGSSAASSPSSMRPFFSTTRRTKLLPVGDPAREPITESTAGTA